MKNVFLQDVLLKRLFENWQQRLSEIKIKPLSDDSLIGSVLISEISNYNKTYQTILNDITTILSVLNEGNQLEKKYSLIVDEITKSIIPKSWNKHHYLVSDSLKWLENFCFRLSHCNSFSESLKLNREKYESWSSSFT